MHWRDQAECNGVSIDIFIGPEEETWNPRRVKLAMQFCNACPVRQECLEYAIKEDIRVGIYGGTTWRQRKMMKIDKNKRKVSL